MREAEGGGGNTIQGLFSSDLHFVWGYVDVGGRWNKKLLWRLYFIISFWCMYICMYICMTPVSWIFSHWYFSHDFFMCCVVIVNYFGKKNQLRENGVNNCFKPLIPSVFTTIASRWNSKQKEKGK